LRNQGGQKLALRVYDVTDIRDMDRQAPHSTKTFPVDERDQDLHVPIPVDDRDYLAELGYETNDGRWMPITRSEHVRVPACPPVPTVNKAATIATAGAGVVAAAAAARPTVIDSTPVGYVEASKVTGVGLPENRIILTPRRGNDAYAYWEISDEAKAALKRQAGNNLSLRLYDVTGGIDLDKQAPNSVQQFDCDELAQDRHLTVNTSNRDYIAELGYETSDGRWLKLARSAATRVPAPDAESRLVGAGEAISDGVDAALKAGSAAVSGLDDALKAGGTAVAGGLDSALKAGAAAIMGGAAAAAGAAASVRAAVSGEKEHDTTVTRIVLTARSPKDAYVFWEISPQDRERVKRLGGKHFKLRVYEVTGMDMDYVPPHSVQEFDCPEYDQDRHVMIPLSDRDYVAEIGYTTEDGRWLSLVRSLHTRIPGAM
jgi:phosphate transport system substrate-binding protein